MNAHYRFRLFVCFAIFASLIAFVLIPSQVYAHGGHGKTEVQFKIVPSQVADPNKPVIKMGNISISRAEFFSYIKLVGAFQMRADLLQRDFLLHFWVVEGLSRYYPSDINVLMERLIKMGPKSPDYSKGMSDWVIQQAGLYARIYHYYQLSEKNGLDKDPRVVAVFDMFAANQKAQFMEEFVLLGDMKEKRYGVNDFVAGLKPADKKNIQKFYKDPDKAGNVERKERRKRWITYRKDLMGQIKSQRNFDKLEKATGMSGDEIVAVVNNHKIKFAEFIAIHGPVKNDVHWNTIKKSRLSQLMLNYAMADEVDALGILPQSYKDKIALTEKLYLAADQIVRDFGPQVIPGQKVDFMFFREICAYMNLLKLEKIFIEQSAKIPAYQKLWVDEEYLKTVKWDISPAFTPKQATYF